MKLNVLCIGLFILNFFFSCQRNSDFQTEKLKIFKYNEHSNISSLDPAFARTQSNIWAVNQLFSGLVQLNDSLNILPDIAKEYHFLQDGKKIKFILRDDVFFHENQCFSTDEKTRKVTAFDFEYSFQRLKDEKTASPGRWILQNVANFYAENEHIFWIELKEKNPTFLGLLATKYASVVPREAVDFYKENFRRNPVGTGAFQFQLWEENTKLVLRKNKNFYQMDKKGEKLPYLDGISIQFFKEKQSEFLQFIQGNLDMVNSVDASYKDEILTSEGELKTNYQEKIKMLKSDFLNTEYIGFSMENLSDMASEKEIRRAIHIGFSREKMMKYLRNNIGTPAHNGFIPKGLQGFSNKNSLPYNPQKAREIVTNFTKKYNRSPKITLSTDANYVDICEYIQRELQNIGFQCVVNVIPPSTLRQSRSSGKLEAFRASWIADYPDAENYLSLFYSKNFPPTGSNYTFFKNKTFDNWYEMCLNDPSATQREQLYKKMDSLLMEELPIIPLYYDQTIRFVQKNIHGMRTNPLNLLQLKEVRKE